MRAGHYSQCRRISCAVALLLCACVSLRAQDSEEQLVNGRPLENTLVGKDLAVVVRAETQMSDEDWELENDPRFAGFPTMMRVYSVRAVHVSRHTFCVTTEDWDNDRGLDMRRSSVSGDIPVWGSWRLRPRFTHMYMAPDITTDYAGLGAGGRLSESTFAFLQCRERVGGDGGEQAYGYLSWAPDSTWLLGCQGSATAALEGAPGTWTSEAFASHALIPESTTARLEVRRSENADGYAAMEYEPGVYQRLGAATLMYLGYRRHEDNSRAHADSVGCRLTQYFTTCVSAHVEYRWYEHSATGSLTTALAGIEWLF